ncbi:MAG: TfuA-like protein [Polyangiaceae bacterium]
MRAFVFTGPTLSPEEGREHAGAVFLPPAAQGDVLRAALSEPIAIGIIDGYFERVPAVAHKEILWAMSRGVHVLGSASMGALRAAELCAFGMVGVGSVFEAFRDGELEDDDEVAVAHATAEEGYRRLSDAMVTIRATLRSAEQRGLLSEGIRSALESRAKATFYADRSLSALVRDAAELGLSPAEQAALRDFFRDHRDDPKRRDAIAMLKAMQGLVAERPGPKEVRYFFEHTDAWDFIREGVERDRREPVSAPSEGATDTDALAVDELRRTGDLPSAMRGALLRALALALAEQGRHEPRGASLHAAIETFRRARGLSDPESFDRWLKDNAVHDPQRFFRDEACLQWAEAVLGGAAGRCLIDHLKSTGEYALLVARATGDRR